MIRKFFYGPPNWLVTKFTAEDRRMFGFWCILISIVTFPSFGQYTRYIAILSIVALIPNYASETPVEVEEED